MKVEANSIDEYIQQVPEDRREYFIKLRDVINSSLPRGFSHEMNYNMPGWVVPKSLYPNGYHCDPKLPLPFINIANQKNFIALYHLGVYSDNHILQWFKDEYSKASKYKLDMGKSCIRFKKPEAIPYELISELVKKISVEEWIELYERSREK